MLERGSHASPILYRRLWLPVLILAILASSFVFVAPVFAQGTDQITNGLEAVGQAGGIASGETDLITIIGRIINIALGFVGVILLALLLYAGYLWMTSGGETEKVEKAKLMIRNAIIGLLVIVSAFAITQFILNALIGATSSGGGLFGRDGRGIPTFPNRADSLGGGIIESHVPARNAEDVPRNTGIVITFKEPILLSSFIKDYNDNRTPADLTDDPDSDVTVGLNSDVVKIYPTGRRELAVTSAQARVRFTPDRQTFVIRLVSPLLFGSSTTTVPYTVELVSGSSGLLREDGSSAFSPRSGGTRISSDGYSWGFEVSDKIDETPPRIVSWQPGQGRPHAPNVIVQLNFNEAIDPTTATGLVSEASSFTNIEIRATPNEGGDDVRPNGEYKPSNRYRTVEFVSDLSCGTNSCGRTVYCLPGSSNIVVIARAATLSETPPLAVFTSSGVDGITDLAGNSFDGDRDGVAEGRGTDDFSWSFATLSEPDLTAPRIREAIPLASGETSFVDAEQEPQAVFSNILQSSTVNSSNVILRRNESGVPPGTFWWTVRQDFLNSEGAEAVEGEEPVYGRISLEHRPYMPAVEGSPTPPVYQTLLSSGIQNIYQNCFNPASSENPECTGGPNCCDGIASGDRCAGP